MKIHVKILLGEEHTFDVLPTDTVLQVKEKIQERLGIDVPHQRLLFLGKALLDENELSFYPGIKEGSKINLIKKAPQASQSKNGIHKFKLEMIKVLKNYYSDDDALTIVNETIKDLQTKVNLLSFDDLERLATALVQDQENIP